MSDLALKAAGLACAAGSVWFAAYMFNHSDGVPRINAMEDFAIFAQPNRGHAVEAAVREAANEGKARRSSRTIAIDMTPVGSAPMRSATNSGAQRPDVKIVELNDEQALLETREGFRRVRVGDESPEVGKIVSIRRMGDYWVVVATQRSIAQVAPVKDERGFSRP
jgi:hypothetical protein